MSQGREMTYEVYHGVQATVVQVREEVRSPKVRAWNTHRDIEVL